MESLVTVQKHMKKTTKMGLPFYSNPLKYGGEGEI